MILEQCLYLVVVFKQRLLIHNYTLYGHLLLLSGPYVQHAVC